MKAEQMSGMVQGVMQMFMMMMPFGMMSGMMSPMFAKAGDKENRYWWVFWHKEGGVMPVILSGPFTSEVKSTKFVEDNEMLASEYKYTVFSSKHNDAKIALGLGYQKSGLVAPAGL